jgi:3-oxoacyl-[acyl-carrier-protein] synthase II
MIIVGGLSYVVNDAVLDGFNQLLAMSVNPDPDKASRPFTKNRDGFIMGEGGGTVVLESEEHAKARGARIRCELAGASMTCEAFNMTAPKTDGEGMAEAIQAALDDAGMSPDEIGYINAHGTSTNLNDLYETMAIKKVFGENAYNIPVSSIKAAIGHTLVAGGALEGIACIKALETGILPPTVHFDEPDPELDLNYIPNKAIKKDIKAAASNSFGFGGNNSTLIFRKYE